MTKPMRARLAVTLPLAALLSASLLAGCHHDEGPAETPASHYPGGQPPAPAATTPNTNPPGPAGAKTGG